MSSTFKTTQWVNAKSVFIITLLVITLTLIGVWVLGMSAHHTLYENALRSVTILSVFFFLFMAIGLYQGIQLRDNVGDLTQKMNLSDVVDFTTTDGLGSPGDYAGEGIAGILIGFVLWVVVSLLLIVLAWLVGAVLWAGLVLFIAMLYWIFFRALRFVLRHAAECKGSLMPSIGYAFGYTVLYSAWIYGIIYSLQYWGVK
jgi:hypothetical protein